MLPEAAVAGNATLKCVPPPADRAGSGRSVMKKLVTGAAVGAALFVARLAFNLISAEPLPEPSPADYANEAAEIDSAVEEELAAGGGAPALNWLAGPDNMLFEGDPRAVQALIEDLYEAGAADVWFMGIEPFGGKNLSAAIAVELPDDPEARARVFAAEAAFWEEPEPRPDVGQRFVEITFD